MIKKIAAWRKKSTDDPREESIAADVEEEPITEEPKEDPITVKPKDNPINEDSQELHDPQ